MTRRSLAVAVVVACIGALGTWLAVPPPLGATVTGFHFAASAQSGGAFATDDTALVPYADQAVSSSSVDLSEAGALAQAAPIRPGDGVGLVGVVLAVGCPTCPGVPPVAKLVATSRPPENTSDDVVFAAITAGPATMGGPEAHTHAVIADHADATAASGEITGIETTPGVAVGRSSTETETVADGPVSRARADITLNGVGFVAIASAAPKVAAVIGIAQPDGTIAALPADGTEIAPGVVVKPAVEAGNGSARAGAFVERTADNGSVERTQVLSVAASATTGAPAAAASWPDVALVPSGASAAIGEHAGAFSFTPARLVPSPTAAASVPTAFPSVRPAAYRTIITGRGAWLIWLFVAWLLLAAATTGAGRRWLAPRIAMRGDEIRLARASAIDHLDRLS